MPKKVTCERNQEGCGTPNRHDPTELLLAASPPKLLDLSSLKPAPKARIGKSLIKAENRRCGTSKTTQEQSEQIAGQRRRKIKSSQ